MTRAAAALLGALVSAGFLLGGCGAKPRPNVLVLVMDTTRADRCSFGGYARPTTPRLEEFAKDAVVFRDAWSPAGWTGPAHASLFTGLRPDHHGFHDGDRNYLAQEVPTLAERLRELGYATGCFTNNTYVAPEFGLTRGFGTVERLYDRPKGSVPKARETHELAAGWAKSAASRGEPFFLFVNDMEPHVPYDPPEADAKRFLRGDPTKEEIEAARNYDLPLTLAYLLRVTELTPRRLAIVSDLYDAEVASLDREVGAFLDRLRADELLDSTIVVVTADHGELFGEHHMVQHGFSLHRAARHVPLVVRYPGVFDRGRVVTSLVKLEDVHTTILEMCGADAPEQSDGVSLAREGGRTPSIAVQGSDPSKKARHATMLPDVDLTPITVGMRAVYDGRWHFLAYTDGRTELYDVSRDPQESENLAAREPAEAARLSALLPAVR
jgi:arylsulfatase A-like enzyme